MRPKTNQICETSRWSCRNYMAHHMVQMCHQRRKLGWAIAQKTLTSSDPHHDIPVVPRFWNIFWHLFYFVWALYLTIFDIYSGILSGIWHVRHSGWHRFVDRFVSTHREVRVIETSGVWMDCKRALYSLSCGKERRRSRGEVSEAEETIDIKSRDHLSWRTWRRTK